MAEGNILARAMGMFSNVALFLWSAILDTTICVFGHFTPNISILKALLPCGVNHCLQKQFFAEKPVVTQIIRNWNDSKRTLSPTSQSISISQQFMQKPRSVAILLTHPKSGRFAQWNSY